MTSKSSLDSSVGPPPRQIGPTRRSGQSNGPRREMWYRVQSRCCCWLHRYRYFSLLPQSCWFNMVGWGGAEFSSSCTSRTFLRHVERPHNTHTHTHTHGESTKYAVCVSYMRNRSLYCVEISAVGFCGARGGKRCSWQRERG